MVNVKLISYTQPAETLEGIEEAQDLIAYCARVSNPGNQNNTDTAEKLVNFLIKHKHWSPLEMVDVTLEIETTRDIGRQILRHRSFQFQEFSQRYADPTKELEFELREARLQDPKNRQNSLPLDDEEIHSTWEAIQGHVINEAREAYKWAIENGIAKEQARVVLPEGNTISRMYIKGPLRSWIHYCELRSSHGTQKEHMEIAKECARVISQVFPVIGNYD